jgi:hypothetical protein
VQSAGVLNGALNPLCGTAVRFMRYVSHTPDRRRDPPGS